MMTCPRCRSDKGLYTTIKIIQYYDWNGDSAGYSDDYEDESKYGKCINCGKKILLRKVREKTEKRK